MCLVQDCKNDKTSQIKIELIDESPFHLKGSFPGPEGTPYEGGNFEVVRIRNLRHNSHFFSPEASALGHRDPRVVSFPTRQDEVYHEGLPP